MGATSIISAAIDTFNNGGYEYGSSKGQDKNKNGLKEVDCSNLVATALQKAGALSGLKVAEFATTTLFGSGGLTDLARERFDEVARGDAVRTTSELQPGDLILWKSNGGSSQHIGIFHHYDEDGSPIFFGSQTSTGPALAKIGGKGGDYWAGTDANHSQTIVGALRIKPEYIVPEFDQTGATSTGIGTPRVAALVNFLKTDGVEAFRPGIYSDSVGIPTFGNGFALVVKGSNGWVIRAEDEIKSMFRSAGISESRYGELPLDKLSQAAQFLQSKNNSSARALFGDGKAPASGEFSVTAPEADRLTAAFVITQVLPKMLSGLADGDPSVLNLMETGEFVALGSRLYMQPNWLASTDGGAFLNAWYRSDEKAAIEVLGNSENNRSKLEIAAYRGEVNDVNVNLGSAGGPALSASSEPPGGHWLDLSNYDLLTGIMTGPEYRVWIPNDPIEKSPAPVNTPALATTKSQSEPSRVTVIQNGDGITVQSIAEVDSPNREIRQGDLVTQIFDLNRSLESYSISHTEVGQTTLTTKILNPREGEIALAFSMWNGSALQFQKQWDFAGNLVGNQYTAGGVTYTRSVLSDGSVNWFDPNGLSLPERIQQSYDQEIQRLFDREDTGGGSDGSGGDGDEGGDSGDGGEDTGDGEQASGPAQTVGMAPQADNAAASALQAAATLGLINTIIGLQHWDQQSDLSHASTVVAIYNQLNGLGSGKLGDASGLGGLAELGVGLGLLSALDSGNVGGIIVNGIGLGNAVFDGAFSKAIGSALGIDAANVVPGLGLLIALDSGDPVSIASAALAFVPGWGQVAAAVLSVVGGLFEEDIPMKEGQAQANWDQDGRVYVSTTQDVEGGGASAISWMNSIVAGLQSQLERQVDAAGRPLYGLIPQRLPTLGYQYDPDGMNYVGAAGHLYLKWTDASGQEQTRYYNGNGERNDGTGDTLMGDFIAHASQAVVPTWESQTMLAHWQRTAAEQGVDAANDEARRAPATGMPQELADHLHQALKVLTINSGETVENLIDIDGDGYLERAQWVSANQGVLALDRNGDGLISPGEFLTLDTGNARSALAWLDANDDGILDSRDPAFAAVRVWMDSNSDGQSSNDELQAAQDAGIVAVDFRVNPPQLVYADGSRIVLTEQTLSGDILGVAYQANPGGVLEARERGETVLHALNSRDFDGQSSHVQGGVVTGPVPVQATIGVNDSRLLNTGGPTPASAVSNVQNIAVLSAAGFSSGALGLTLTGQAAQPTISTQPTPGSRFSPVTFVPATPETPTQAKRQVTAQMLSSLKAEGVMSSPLVAVAIGMGAVQWPVVASATLGTGEGLVLRAPTGVENFNGHANQSSGVNDPSGITSAAQGMPGNVGTTGDATGGSKDFPGNVRSGLTGNGATSSATDADPFQTFGPASGSFDVSSPESKAIQQYPGVAGAAGPSQISDEVPGLQLPRAFEMRMMLDFPQVRGERLEAVEDVMLRVSAASLLANDSTGNLPPFEIRPTLRLTAVGGPEHGQVALELDATGHVEVIFLPEANYHGSASFSYTVTDQYGLSSIATATVEIAARNDAPLTRGEISSGDEDNILMFTAASLLANDIDVDSAVDGDILRITRVGLAQHGTVFLGVDGTVRFIPDANYNGPAMFSYWVGDRSSTEITAGEGFEVSAAVALTILAVNDLPVVEGESVAGDEDVVLSIAQSLLLLNDSDVDTATTNAEAPQVLAITAVGNAVHGRVSLQAGGTIEFIPEANYFGVASFVYTVDDGHGGRVDATAVINLAPINDAPVVVGESININEDEVLAITQASLLANDSDVDNSLRDLRIVAVDNATHGVVMLDADGSIRYAPDADYFGVASFTYTVSDGSGGFTVGTARLDIAPVNDAPRLTGEVAAPVDEDTQVRIAVSGLLLNDSDVDNSHAELQISSVGEAMHGVVQLVAGEIVFTPDSNYFGSASFSYTVIDGVGGQSQAKVTLAFDSVNDLPVVSGELVLGKRDVTYTLSRAAMLANDVDIESPAALTITAVQNVAHGTATLHVDGSVTFVPEMGYAGRGSFEYVVTDADGGHAIGLTEIDFSRVNVTPVAVDDSFAGFEDTAFIIGADQLLVNDSDPDAGNIAALTVDSVRNASHGVVVLRPDGSVRFDPDANYFGPASFEYRVNDGEGGQTWARAVLNVQSVNDAPVIEDIIYGTPVYGYERFGYGTGRDIQYEYVQVTDESQARGLVANWALYTQDNQHVSPSYYRNGELRPFLVTPIDSRSQPRIHEGYVYIDDPYRENGKIIAYDPDGDSSAITIGIGTAPQHGHAWANAITPYAALPDSDYSSAPSRFVSLARGWQYYSHAGDPYAGSDPFVIRVTDGDGASTNVSISTAHYGSSAGGGGSCPIVLDLNGDGVNLVRPEDSSFFSDINHDGWRERIGWAAADDGVLTFDANDDGLVDLDNEISFVGYKQGAHTDLEGLSGFDTDGDGKITAQDKDWSRLGVFHDLNTNGQQDEGERISLDELGVVAIGLQRDGAPHLDKGNVVFGTTTVEFANGKTWQAADVMFAGEGVALPQQVKDILCLPTYPAVFQDGERTSSAPVVEPAVREFDQDAHLAQMALVFNQYCTSASANTETLGFVDWALVGSEMASMAGAVDTVDGPPALPQSDLHLNRSPALQDAMAG